MPRNIDEIVREQIRKSEMARKDGNNLGSRCDRPVVTISRRMGSGARVVAIKLAEELGWSLWGKDLINAMAENADVSKRVADAFDERTMSEIEIFARSILGDYEMGGYIYTRHLAKAVATIARLGNAIILGRGANYLLPNALHVRIDSSFERRVENMMAYESLTREQAEKKLRTSDKERDNYLIQTFGKERVMNFNYDLTIWMDKFSNEGAVEMIKMAIKDVCLRGVANNIER